jgi:hypothetical protein
MAEEFLLRVLHHLHDGQRFAIPERDSHAFYRELAFQAIEHRNGLNRK